MTPPGADLSATADPATQQRPHRKSTISRQANEQETLRTLGLPDAPPASCDKFGGGRRLHPLSLYDRFLASDGGSMDPDTVSGRLVTSAGIMTNSPDSRVPTVTSPSCGKVEDFFRNRPTCESGSRNASFDGHKHARQPGCGPKVPAYEPLRHRPELQFPDSGSP
jgi:hypothetical protein